MMSQQTNDSRIRTFIQRLDQLDRADCARLRRNAGKTLPEAHQSVLSLFYGRLLPPQVHPAQENIYFLVATLYLSAPGGNSGNLGHTLRQVRQKDNAPGLDRRIEILLDADERELPHRLRQVIRYLASRQARVNGSQLMTDLLYWSHPERFVQRQWARAYFAP